MDINTVLVILICILIVLIIYLILKVSNINNHDLDQRLLELQKNTNQQNESSIKLNEKINYIGKGLNEILKETNQSSIHIQDVYERVNDMNNIMINKKKRGNFGEYQLNNLLSIYAGESDEIYETQYLLQNGYIGDVALHLPGSEQVLIIDSKFPVENYTNLSRDDISDIERDRYHSLFRQDIKKHINDISKKYITKETSENAVMFIPSEAIYFYLCSECDELIGYAHTHHVLITSPTTLLGVVFTFINITKDIKRTKNIKSLEKDIVNMYEDAKRLIERVDNVDRALERLQTSIRNVSISSNKIADKIERIHDGYSEDE
jgi:DNA recombination protein RmuC